MQIKVMLFSVILIAAGLGAQTALIVLAGGVALEVIALARRILPQAAEIVPSTTKAVAATEHQVAVEETVDPRH